jgi:hypothetical protein
MNYILATGTVRLTTESAASSYGVPVLVIEIAGGWNRELGPADLIGDFGDEGMCHAAEFVETWAKLSERTAEEREAARLFLASWPEGPQLP